MKLGTNDIGSVYLGTNAVQKVYLGTNEVWSSFTGLLDTYTGAAAAYSLRKLRSAYTGSAIRVRIDTTGQPEYNIGFVNNELDVATLEGYCTGGLNAFVKTWYDQSGNGYDAEQTTEANQPQIVSSGSVILDNNKPSVQFDGSDDYIGSTINNFQNYTNLSTINVFSTAISAASDTNSYQGWSFGKFGSPSKIIAYSSSTGGLSNETILISFPNGTTDRRLASTTYTRNANDQNLLTSFNLSSGTSLYSNGSSVNLNLSINATTSTNSSPSSTTYTDDNNVYLGAILLTSGSIVISPQMKYQELIFYPSDQSSNRTGIETNINDYYSIY